MRYLFFDCETGHIEPDKGSLLTAFFLVTDDRGRDLAGLDLALMPDEGPIVATAEALAVNGIDLAEHVLRAAPYRVGRAALEEFLSKFFPWSELVPVAHNATFDLSFLHEHLIPRGRWEQLVTGRQIDTCVLWRRYHQQQGVKVSARLQDVAAHYGMAGRYEAHTAGGDVLLMRDLYFHVEELKASPAGVDAYGRAVNRSCEDVARLRE